MLCNKDVDFTIPKNSVSDTGKFQSFPISSYNVDNIDKSLSLSLFAALKAFQYKKHVFR